MHFLTEFTVWAGGVALEWWCIACCVFLFSGLCACFFGDSKSGFAAWCVVCAAFFLWGLLDRAELSPHSLAVFACCAAVVCGVAFLILSLAIRLKKQCKLAAAKGREKRRKIEFLLPDRGNEYLRERLTAIKPQEEERTETGVKAEYARSLLARLKAAPLSAVERLQAEELSKQLTLYFSKAALTATELRALSDCFSSLLKLAAKHGV